MYQSLQCLLLAFLLACGTPPSDEMAASSPTGTHATPASTASQQSMSDAQSNYPYAFDAPDAIIELPKELREISGITQFDAQHLAAVQDEKGRVYKISLETGKIIGEERFEKDGDFEDIERVGEIFYVLRSDGDVFETGTWPLKSKDTERHKTSLKAKCDAEGLTYDPADQRLLIACKEDAGPDMDNVRAVYAFDLGNKKLEAQPVYTVSMDALSKYSSEHAVNRVIRKLIAPVTDMNRFKPAAIALHPETGHLFVISSVQKLLIALTTESEIHTVWELSEELFPQPEGLVFMPNGDLYISNEGRGGKATILRFNHD